jgi:predicted SprT family Zn-dependent metalloprotease
MPTPIPYRIRVGDKLYSIDVVETMRRKNEMGRTYYDLQRIEIGETSNVNGRKYTENEIDDTFWHELVHAILFEMGHRLHNNEDFVTAFAGHLAKAIKSAKFN